MCDRAVRVWVLGSVVIFVAAAATGMLLYATWRPQPYDVWADANHPLSSMAGGLLVAVGWVVLLVLATRRLVPAGRRVAFVVAALLAPVVVSPLVGLLYGWATHGSLRGLAASLVTVPVAGVVAPPATLWLLDRRESLAARP